MLLNITEFIGRFHPLLVHLPIGILLLALVLQWLSKKQRYANLQPAVNISYLLGFLGAVLSCITGWLLASGGGYNEDTLATHKWMGIAVAAVALVGYLVNTQRAGNIISIATAIALFLLLNITGHLGGTLTHGEGYLTNAWNSADSDTAVAHKKIIANVQEAKAYEEVVAPILQAKCYNCHNATKQKGGLRIDGKDWLLKGGKNGDVLVAGKPDESELYQRLMLDPLEEKHMPPKGKPQLTETEITLLHWWIANGMSFDQPVKQFTQNTKEKEALISLQSSATNTGPKPAAVPLEPVEAAPEKAIAALQKAGVSVLPVAANSNYLVANFVSIKSPDEKTLALLDAVKKQLVWLKLSGATLTDNGLKTIAACTNITMLSLDRTNTNDSGLVLIASLPKLYYLNLVGTAVTEKGLVQLKGLKALREVYLFQSAVNKTAWQNIEKTLPGVRLDSGGYSIPVLVSDTSLVSRNSSL